MYIVSLLTISDHSTFCMFVVQARKARIRALKRAQRRKKCQQIGFIILKILVPMIPFLALTAQDISMFIINAEEECTLGTDGGNSQYVSFSLSTWMFWASVIHFSTLLVLSGLLAVLGICDHPRCAPDCLFRVILVIVSSVGTFLSAWTVIGFLLHEEIRNHGVNDQKCNAKLLAWLIIYMVQSVLACPFLVWLRLWVFMRGLYMTSNKTHRDQWEQFH